MKFRFSTKTLLAVVTLSAIALAMFRARLDSSRLQRQAVANLTTAGISARYDYEDDSTIGADDPFSATAGANAPNGSPTIKINPLRLWIGRMLGRDFVADVKEVYLSQPRSAGVVAQLRDVRRIETLRLNVSTDFQEFQDDAWQELMKCRNVERLELRHHQFHPGRRLAGLSAWQQLRSLTISGGEFIVADGQEVARLTNLQQLSLHPVQASDEAVAPLAALHRLEELELSYPAIGPQVASNGAAFLADLPHLRVLSLPRLPALDDNVFSVLERMPKLELLSLNLDQADVSGATVELLARLTKLKMLSLTRTQVDDAALAKLSRLTQLEELYLSGTQITDAGLEHLSAFVNLRNLYLGNTDVTDAGLKHLSGLTNLRRLSLGEEVSPAAIAELQKLIPGCIISQPSLLSRQMAIGNQSKSRPAVATTPSE